MSGVQEQARSISFKCNTCGKRVYHFRSEWGYAYGTKRFCSYKCMRAFERAKENAARQRQTAIRVTGGGIDKVFPSINSASHALNVEAPTILAALQREKPVIKGTWRVEKLKTQQGED